MRRIILLSSILLLSTVWAAAQNDSDSDSESSTASSKMTVEGCLDGAIGNYTLTDHAGASYQLTGDLEQLKAHVGETMRVTGVVTPIVHVPGAMSEGTETQPTLSVTSLKRISTVCRDADYIP
jgi:hypothetical protein